MKAYCRNCKQIQEHLPSEVTKHFVSCAVCGTVTDTINGEPIGIIKKDDTGKINPSDLDITEPKIEIYNCPNDGQKLYFDLLTSELSCEFCSYRLPVIQNAVQIRKAIHSTKPELAPVIRYCNNCKQNRTRNINGNCLVCNADLAKFVIKTECPHCCSDNHTQLLQENKNKCLYCGLFIPNGNTFAETLGILDDLKDEFILLESIRQTAKELCDLFNEQTEYSGVQPISDKIDELRHLVETD